MWHEGMLDLHAFIKEEHKQYFRATLLHHVICPNLVSKIFVSLMHAYCKSASISWNSGQNFTSHFCLDNTPFQRSLPSRPESDVSRPPVLLRSRLSYHIPPEPPPSTPARALSTSFAISPSPSLPANTVIWRIKRGTRILRYPKITSQNPTQNPTEPPQTQPPRCQKQK